MLEHYKEINGIKLYYVRHVLDDIYGTNQWISINQATDDAKETFGKKMNELDACYYHITRKKGHNEIAAVAHAMDAHRTSVVVDRKF